MSLNLICEVWDAMRSHIDLNERNEAADTLVNLLVDNNFEADEIKEAFRGEKEVLNALKNYVNHQESDEDFDEDYDEEDDW